MDWIKLFYGLVGAAHPIASTVVVAVIGACIFGGIWWAIGQQYEREHPPSSTTVAPKSVVAPTQPTAAPQQNAEQQAAWKLSDVTWDFAKAGDARSRYPTLFSWGSGSAGFWITFFRISGQNNSTEPLVDVNAYVQPQIYSKRIPLKFELQPNQFVDTAGYVIEPGASFILAAPVPSQQHAHGWGYVAADFLAKMGGFEFVFEAKSHHFSRKFTYAEVKEMAELAEKDNGPKPPPPSVRKRE